MNKFIPTVSSAAFGIAIAAASCTALADNSSAASGQEDRSITVSYSDLDLSHAAGAETLYSRLRNAANAVCGPKVDLRKLRERRTRQQCVASALDNAVADVAAPELQELHFAETGRQTVENNRALASSE
jgi:UrcA family protein